MRATSTVGTSRTSAASRAETSVRMNWLVGTSTLPPRWPHFFSDESWSSKWTPAAPASMNAFMSSNALSGPPKPASASATIGASQYVPFLALGGVDLVGAEKRAVDPLHERRRAVRRVQALVGVRVPGEVRVGRHLPAGEVDRLQAGLDHLHGLRAGQRAERGDVVLGVEELPEPLGPEPRERVLDVEAAADALDVVRAYGRSTPVQRAVRLTCAHLAPPGSIVCNLDWIGS